MAQEGTERSPIGRTILGGSACGFTYDAALLDAVAREDRLRRPLRLVRWRHTGRVAAAKPERELARASASGPDRQA